MHVDPRELSTGYVHSQGKGVSAYWGVLRDGSAEVWRCGKISGHRAHILSAMAVHCAEAELERRMQGAKSVLAALHCAPCWAFWDLGGAVKDGLPEAEASALMRGLCPRCTGPAVRVKVAVLEREEASVR
jgi:hypothetical protein